MIYLITGATGSFGQAVVSELLANWQPKSIRLFSRNEYLQWDMRQKFTDERLRWMIGDVRDKERLTACMADVNYVIHAAALKHIDVGQYNPQEFVRTNVLGSINIVEVAASCEVKKVLAISTDKAVYPSSLYGATKLAMEILFLDSNRWAWPKTKFSIYRPGNYFESHGNVFELWAEQCKNGVCTLTDERMQRYFIRIQDAAKIALKCLHSMEGGEIYIPKMKEYLMLELLAERYPNVEVKIIGKREAEKLKEPIYTEEETQHLQEFDEYYMIREAKWLT